MINATEQLDFLIDYLIEERGEEIDVPQDYHSKRGLLRSLMNVRPPLKISDEFLRVQDEFLTAETSNKTLTSPQDIKEVKGKIKLWQGDITTLKVDAIVNAANSKLLGCFIPQHNCIDNVGGEVAGIGALRGNLAEGCEQGANQERKREKVRHVAQLRD